MMNFVYAGDDDAGIGGGDDVSIDDYVGSVDVNPEQIPLIDEFDREGKSKEEIDTLISYAEGEFFKTPEQIEASREAKEKADKEKKGKEKDDGDKEDDDKSGDDDNADDDKEDKGTDKGKKDGGKKEEGEEGEDEKAFFEQSGLTRETFTALPEATQEILVDKVMGKNEASEEVTTLKQEVENLTAQIASRDGDTIIAARLQEIASGRSIVAKADNFITDQLMLKIDNLLGEEKMADAKKLLTTEINKQISNQNAVIEGQRLTAQLENDTWKNLLKLGKFDKRLIIEEKDHRKMAPGHKEYMDFEKGTKQILAWAKESGITNLTLSKMTPKAIYAAFAAHVGWDKDNSKNTFKAGRESLLKNLRKPKMAGAKSLKQDKQIAHGPGATGGSVDRATLKAELREGNTTNWEYMLDRSEGDPAKISELNEILQESREEKRQVA
jgi:hypothetical protein